MNKPHPHRAPRAKAAAYAAPTMLASKGWGDYALLDSGDGEKLERYGRTSIVRPEPQAMWSRQLPAARWEGADATFVGAGAGDEDAGGRWRYKKPIDESWPITFDGVTILCRFTAFRHVGLFPEQETHWRWMLKQIATRKAPVRVLNLFAYTGVASLLAARAGAEVTHVDASKKAIAWARENQTLSRLDSAKVRWICDDAMKFVEREGRRGNRYDGIVLDPPKFGRGPKGEVWDLFTDLKRILVACRGLLSDDPLFLILTAYSIRASYASIDALTRECLADLGGTVESGELVLVEETGGRPISTSLFSRWSSG